jgi:hypothetical protein
MAETANDRISKLRVSSLNAQHRGALADIEAKYHKQFKIDGLTKKVREAKKKLREAQHALDDAKEEARKAMQTEVSKVEKEHSNKLEGELVRTHSSTLTILGATLPEDIRKELKIEETKKMLTDGGS